MDGWGPGWGGELEDGGAGLRGLRVESGGASGGFDGGRWMV